MSGERLYVVEAGVDPQRSTRCVDVVRRVSVDDFTRRTTYLIRAKDELDAFNKVAALEGITAHEFVEALGEWY